MPFIVIYRAPDGTSCHQQVESLDEAAQFVERLRNTDGCDDVRIYRMDEISFAFRPYYKVELGAAETTAPAVVPVTAARLAETPAAVERSDVFTDRAEPLQPPVLSDEDADPSGANGYRGLFGR